MFYRTTLCLLTSFLIPTFGLTQTLTFNNNISFGVVEVSSVPFPGNLTMGTNGQITYPSNASGSGIGTAGQVTIGGTVGQVVNIRCSSSATMGGNVGNIKLTVSPVKVSVGSGQNYVAATSCNAINRTVLSHTLSSNSSLNVVFMGGQIQTSGKSPNNQTYSTSAGGGTAPITLRVVYN